MRSADGAYNVKRVFDIRDPIAQRPVHRVFQRARTGRHSADFRAQQTHAEHVGFLALDIQLAHINHARQVEQRGNRCRRDSVLPRAGFRDDARFAHTLGKQDLPHAMIDFMRACVVQLFALQIDLCAAQMFGQSLREEKRRGAPHIMLEVIIKLCLKAWIGFRLFISGFDRQNQRHECFWHITPPIGTEMPVLIRLRGIGIEFLHGENI